MQAHCQIDDVPAHVCLSTTCIQVVVLTTLLQLMAHVSSELGSSVLQLPLSFRLNLAISRRQTVNMVFMPDGVILYIEAKTKSVKALSKSHAYNIYSRATCQQYRALEIFPPHR